MRETSWRAAAWAFRAQGSSVQGLRQWESLLCSAKAPPSTWVPRAFSRQRMRGKQSLVLSGLHPPRLHPAAAGGLGVMGHILGPQLPFSLHLSVKADTSTVGDVPSHCMSSGHLKAVTWISGFNHCSSSSALSVCCPLSCPLRRRGGELSLWLQDARSTGTHPSVSFHSKPSHHRLAGCTPVPILDP